MAILYPGTQKIITDSCGTGRKTRSGKGGQGMFGEFKKFIARGNVLDLAVAVVLGAAFGSIVTSVVEDLLNPVLGLLGDRNFSDLYLVVKGTVPAGTPYEQAKGMAVVFGYGAFLTAVLNFLIISFSIFVIVKLVGRMLRKREETEKQAPTPVPSGEELLLSEIRDLLKQNRTDMGRA